MSKKPKFKPTITRVKLNPEQAVLTCGCYSTGQHAWGGDKYWGHGTWVGHDCVGSGKAIHDLYQCQTTNEEADQGYESTHSHSSYS